MSFAENLAGLPAVDGLAGLDLSTADGRGERIENRAGSAGSLRIYAFLAGKYGVIDATAATEGLRLYAEHAADARAHPGKHPNIDRLLVTADGGEVWQARPIPAGQ